MKILILGGTGMLGHRLWADLSNSHEVWATVRNNSNFLDNFPQINLEREIIFSDLLNNKAIDQLLDKVQPEIVINCIGIIKQVQESYDHVASISINALFPHLLATSCMDRGIRLITFSTDCVFDGKSGRYSEESTPNPKDLYGKTKLMGEVSQLENVLTLRTSLIGREIIPRGSLVDWFLSQEGKTVRGYKNAIFSGFTTSMIAKIMDQHILPDSSLAGVLHLASAPISKFDLLSMISDYFKMNITIREDFDFEIDRSLNGEKFVQLTGFSAPSWESMIEGLLQDRQIYKN